MGLMILSEAPGRDGHFGFDRYNMTAHVNLPPSLPSFPRNFKDDQLAVIARQAIVNEQREVFGYELFDRSTAPNAFNAASDAALLFNSLTLAGADSFVGKRTIFINCTHDSLAGGHLELVHPDKIVLEIPTLGEDSTVSEIEDRLPMFDSLRKRGLRLAFSQNVLRRSYISWWPSATFIKLNMSSLALSDIGTLIKFVRAHTHAQIVAEKVETEEQFEHLRDLGVCLFQGYWITRPQILTAHTLPPSQSTIVQLINLVRSQADIDDIEYLLKRNPEISYNLLRFLNSSGFGLSCQINSFRHAVIILGYRKLFRWSALLLTNSRASTTPSAVGRTAVVRGRLMELLAAEKLPPEESENAFVVGVFSLLDTMLGQPMKMVIDTIALPQPVIDALLHRKGIFAPFLALTLACENCDAASFADAADALNLSNHQVNWAHLHALAWAEDFLDEAGSA